MTTPSGQLAIKDIATIANVSRAAVSNWRARHDDFPQPTPNSPARRPLFDLQQTLTWLKSKDLLSKEAEGKYTAITLRAVANELRTTGIEPMPATILTLFMLALQKHAASHPDSTTWNALSAATTADDLINGIKDASVPVTLEEQCSLSWEDLRSRLTDEVTVNLIAGINRVTSDGYSAAATVFIDTFLGLGGRGELSIYGSSRSASSKLLATAAATTACPGDTVLDPACGIGGTLIDLSARTDGIYLNGTDLFPDPLMIARLQAYLGDIDATFTVADSLAHDPYREQTFTTIVTEPPFGHRIQTATSTALVAGAGVDLPRPKSSDAAFLVYIATHLAPGGYGYSLTTTSVGYQRDLAQLRQTLVAQGLVEAVIQLPAGLLAATRIPTLLWVLKRPHGEPETSLLVGDATEAASPEQHIGQWLDDIRAGRETSIPTRRLGLAELTTLNGDIIPSVLLRDEPDSDEARTDLEESLTQFETTLEQIHQMPISAISTQCELPPVKQILTLQQLIDTGAVIRHRSRHQPPMADDTPDNVEVSILPIRTTGRQPKKVRVPETTRCLTKGDIIVSDLGYTPAFVFTGDDRTWLASPGVTVLETIDPSLDPHYLVACINATFNAAATIDGAIPRRDFKHIDIPMLDHRNSQQVADILDRLEQIRRITDTCHQQVQAVTDAFLSAIRYG